MSTGAVADDKFVSIRLVEPYGVPVLDEQCRSVARLFTSVTGKHRAQAQTGTFSVPRAVSKGYPALPRKRSCRPRLPA